ncbi:hypothetical protein ABTX60_15700 [Streptomyces sp. NPDC126510]
MEGRSDYEALGAFDEATAREFISRAIALFPPGRIQPPGGIENPDD